MASKRKRKAKSWPTPSWIKAADVAIRAFDIAPKETWPWVEPRRVFVPQQESTMPQYNKPFQGVIGKWSQRDGRITGHCYWHRVDQERGGRPATAATFMGKADGITTSPVATIKSVAPGVMLCETKNSYYLLVD